MMQHAAQHYALLANLGTPQLSEAVRRASDEVVRRGLVYAPDPRLNLKAEPVVEMTDHIHALADGMKRLMRSSNGVGLAAPQVGESLRMFVAYDTGTTSVFINPEIVEQNGRHKTREGCLSIPGVQRAVKRARVVRVRRGLGDERVEHTFTGLMAVIIQHEIDHLDGVLMTDRSKHAW